MNAAKLLQNALAFHKAGQCPQAEALYREVLRIQPKTPDALELLGLLLHQTSQSESAVDFFRKAIALNSTAPNYHNNFGIVWRKLGNNQEALKCFQRALQLDDHYADAWFNLGNTLRDQDRPSEALICYEKSDVLHPGCADVATNRGATLEDLGQFDDALLCHEKALVRQPDYPEARWNRSMIRLRQGDFAKGWVDYEWRWQVKHLVTPPRSFPQPIWQGEPLAGRTILLHAEQGFGDTLQFVRYAPLLAQNGARVIVECQVELQSLFESIPNVQIIPRGTPLPAFDCHVPLLGLPRLFRTTLENIPDTVPYLFAARREHFSQVLTEKKTLRIGIAWGGNPTHKDDRHRSISLSQWLPIFSVAEVSFFSLQCGPRAAELAGFGTADKIIDLSPHLRDFADTAAAMQLLDLIITVDTSVAHLAGALGRPVWTLLKFVPEWRWLLNREDSPWYPTMRLFRQPALGDWTSVMRKVAEAIRVEAKPCLAAA